MRSEILSQENNVVSIKLEFDASEFAKGVEKAVRELSSKVNIAGFRKGHVPRKVMEMRFGKQAIFAEAIEEMLPEAIHQIVKEYDLDLIDEPHVTIDRMEEGEPVDIKLSFEVTPEIELPELADITVNRTVSVVSDEEVEDTVQQIRLQNATLSVAERPVSEGDVVDIEYNTIVLLDNNSEERHGPDSTSVDLSQASVRAEIREALVGADKGDVRLAEVKVDDDYQDPKVAGKTVRYELTVKDVKEKILPELEPDFFKNILRTECETEDAFRDEVKNRILEKLSAENQSRAEFEALEAVANLSNLTIPERLVSRQMAAMKKEDEDNLKKSRGISVEDMLAEASMTMEDYESNIRKQAEIIVRRSLVLDKIGEEMGITVGKEDFEAEMQGLAASYNMDAQRLVDGLFKDEKRVMEMANKIKYKKTVGRIMDTVQVNEVQPEHKDIEDNNAVQAL